MNDDRDAPRPALGGVTEPVRVRVASAPHDVESRGRAGHAARRPRGTLHAAVPSATASRAIGPAWTVPPDAPDDLLAAFFPIVCARLPAILRDVREQFDACDALREVFAPTRGRTALEAQEQHWGMVLATGTDPTFPSQIARVGASHARMETAPQWHLAGYAALLARLYALARSEATVPRERLVELLQALNQAVVGDLEATLNAYHQAFTQRAVRDERRTADALLGSVLPATTVSELRATDHVQPRRHENVSVLFADIVGFTALAHRMDPVVLVEVLDLLFCAFDLVAASNGVEKIKTVGDAYLAIAGLPNTPGDAEAAAHTALSMASFCEQFAVAVDVPLKLRVGLHIGPLIAGVVGLHRISYDVWGDTVNIASRMETSCDAGRVHITDAFSNAIAGKLDIEPRGTIDIKGMGLTTTAWINDRRTQQRRRAEFADLALETLEVSRKGGSGGLVQERLERACHVLKGK